MVHTKKRHTACRGLNKTNCIFPCELVHRKTKENMDYCRSKFQRIKKNAKTKKEKMRIEKIERKTMKKMKSASKKVETGTKEIAKTSSVLGSIGSFFSEKPATKVEEPLVEPLVEEPVVEEPVVEEPVVVEEASKIEPVVESEANPEEEKKEGEQV
jgi:hypothetical protein